MKSAELRNHKCSFLENRLREVRLTQTSPTSECVEFLTFSCPTTCQNMFLAHHLAIQGRNYMLNGLKE